MTLRLRILLLFLGFAVLPVILLGAGDYLQSVDALRTVIDARSEGLAGQTAREVEQAFNGARAGLRAAAEEVARGGDLDSWPEGVSDGPGGRPFSAFRVIQDGTTVWSRGVEPGAPRECTAPGAALPVRVPVPGQDGLVLEADLSVSAFLATVHGLTGRQGGAGYTHVLDGRTGRILYDSGCSRAGERADTTVFRAVEVLATSDATALRSMRYRRDGELWHASVAFVAGPGLGVAVHTSEDEFIAPFRRSRLQYLATVLVILLVAAVVALLLAQVEFRSLRSLIAAADQIELGNLRPWLPPPGEDEVGRLSLAFRKMIDRLSESIRRVEVSQKLAAVGELASYLSHEIRNPLSSIRLSLQSLHRDLSAGFIPPDADRIIAIALNEVKRLDGVVRTVLEVGRPYGEAGTTTCDVHQALEATLEVIHPKVRAQGVDLEFVPRAERDHVRGDAEALRGVWINLIVNALDALQGVQDGRIRVSTWTGPPDEDELHVRIADNGPGIPPDIADDIFEPFFTTKMSGNGIGLPTALRTVQPWDGTITYEPVAAGTGAVFVVKLKLAEAEPAAEDPPDENQMEPALPDRPEPTEATKP